MRDQILSKSALIELTDDRLVYEFKLRSAEAQGPHVEEVNISLKTLFLFIETTISEVAEICELLAVILTIPLEIASILPS